MPEVEDIVPDDSADPSFLAYVCAVWNLIIRPPRARYTRFELMANYPCGKFKVGGRIVVRTNFTLTNARGERLACTLFEPDRESEGDEGRPGDAPVQRACVVHCHGNASCRISGLRLVPALLPLNVALACFDFSGSGMSGGEYVSLGFHERDDLSCVIEHLRGERGFHCIGLWGHSMGAVTALMHAARDPSLAGVVADSPFSDLCQLIEEVCYTNARLPAFMLSPLLNGVRWVIQKKAKFNIRDVSPMAHMGKCFVPALFLHGDKDEFVSPAHSEKLVSGYQGEAQRLLMPGVQHNTRRPEAFENRATVFLIRAMRWEQHLPAGVNEDRLAGMIARSRTGPPRELTVSEQTSQKVEALLQSGLPADRSLALVLTACELCVAYRGASPMHSPSHMLAKCPALFKGHVVFAGDHSDMAICWVQEGSKAATSGASRVAFAVISPAAVSLAEVHLAADGVGHGAAADSGCRKGCGPTCAGLACQAVHPQGVGAPRGGATLELGRQHSVALSIHADGVELSVGDVHVSSKMLGGGEVNLWFMRWEQTGGGASPLLELKREAGCGTLCCQPRREQEMCASDRLTQTLATLCLGSAEAAVGGHVPISV